MTDDPVNPKHYDGRACADIGERLSANGYQILKYSWRLGKKDLPSIELGKALWYVDSEIAFIVKMQTVYPNLRTQAFVADLPNPQMFFSERTADCTEFTRLIARRLWNGYNLDDLRTLRSVIEAERAKYEGS